MSEYKEEEFNVKSDDLIQTIKKIIKEGNVRKITVRKKTGEVIASLPVNVGIVGAVIAPFLAVVGAAAAVLTECKISIEKKVD